MVLSKPYICVCSFVDTFEARQKHEGPKVATVLMIAIRTTPIPVTVGTFEARRKREGPKVTTVTRTKAFKHQKTTTVTRIET